MEPFRGDLLSLAQILFQQTGKVIRSGGFGQDARKSPQVVCVCSFSDTTIRRLSTGGCAPGLPALKNCIPGLILRRVGVILLLASPGATGEIGKRTGFRSQHRKVCGFKSHVAHHFSFFGVISRPPAKRFDLTEIGMSERKNVPFGRFELVLLRLTSFFQFFAKTRLTFRKSMV